MAYNQPGVRVRQEIAESELIPVESEMPTCIVGPLFQVVNDGLCLNSLDPLSDTDPTIPWKLADGTDIPVGSVVDLSGVNNQLIDSQRKILYDIVASFQLKDITTGQVTPVNDSDVSQINVDGFVIDVDATRVSRATVSDVYVVPVDGVNKIYAPGGGFTALFSGDRFLLDGQKLTVASVPDTKNILVEGGTVGLTATESTLKPFENGRSFGPSVGISATPSGGNVLLTSSFNQRFLGVEVGDVALTGYPRVGFSDLGEWQAPVAVNDGSTSNAVHDAVGLECVITLNDITEYEFLKAGTVLTIQDNIGVDRGSIIKSVDAENAQITVFSSAVEDWTTNTPFTVTHIQASAQLVGKLDSDVYDGNFAGSLFADSRVDGSLIMNGDTVNSIVNLNTGKYAVLANVPFSAPVGAEEFKDSYCRISTSVVNSTPYQEAFCKVVEIDYEQGLVLLDVNSTGVVEPLMNIGPNFLFGTIESFKVTFLDTQLGSVVSKTDDSQITVSVEETTFSASQAFVEVFSAADAEPTVTFYAPVQVESTFRVLRRDLANTVLSAQDLSELNAAVGSGYTPDHRDGLGFAVQVATSAQPTESRVYFIPVDLFPDAVIPDGLPESWNLSLGYSSAFDKAETVDVYNIVPLNNSASVQSLLVSHVNTMSSVEESMERRGFVVVDVPLGQTESTTGQAVPGMVPGGVFSGSGNAIIKDENVLFSQAGVSAGTKVVITFPPDLEGTYVATSDTTDLELHLDKASGWDIKEEFSVTAAGISTLNGVHTITGFDTSHVQVGDYVHLDGLTPATPGGLGASTYVFRVISVNGNDLNAVDEAPGTLTFSSSGLSGYVVRSWGYWDGSQNIGPSVQYYIDPLSKTEQVTSLSTLQTFQNRRITAMIAQSPEVETNLSTLSGVLKTSIAPEYSAVAVAAKRSGLQSNEEVTNLTLGGGIVSCAYAIGHFSRGQLNQLAEAGYTLIEQKSATAQPFVRDMITSITNAGLVSSEEIVTSNADWQSKTLRATFAAKVGSKLSLLTPRLIGIRSMQIDAILNNWKNQNPPRLLSYRITKVGKNATNPRQLDIEYVAVFPLAEKEIEFVMELSVGE